MTVLALIGHLLNWIAPAAGVGVLLWGGLRLWPSARSGRWAARRELLLLIGVGAAVLLAGLIIWGRDAKMLTYAALVLAQGSLVWWMRGR
jgi:hypothetical protein